MVIKCNQEVEAPSSHDNELLYQVLGLLEPIVAYGFCWDMQEYQLHDLVNNIEDKIKSKYCFLVFQYYFIIYLENDKQVIIRY